MPGTPSSETISTKQQRIATLAKQSPQMAFTTLSHYLDLEWLREAYRLTRKDGAVGVDGQTAREYEQDLEANLQSLLNRVKSGQYHVSTTSRAEAPVRVLTRLTCWDSRTTGVGAARETGW